VIFIFISDIGADRMTKLVLSYGNRSAIPQALLRSEIKTALDAQWSRLRLGKFVTEVVPYLPLEPEHIREILQAKLRNMASSHRHSYWAELIVDADVLSLIAAPPMVKYSVYSAKTATPAGAQGSPVGSGTCSVGTGAGEESECAGGAASSEAPTVTAGQGTGTTKVFATWGARSLENAGELFTDEVTPVVYGLPLGTQVFVLTSVYRVGFNFRPAARPAQPHAPACAPLEARHVIVLCASASSNCCNIAVISVAVRPRLHRSHSLEVVILAFVLTDDLSLYTSGSSDQIMHVGLVSEGNRELRNAKWGTQEKAGTITPKTPKQVWLAL
jgi:hypothetical protein